MENPKESMGPEVPMAPWAWPLDLAIYDRTPALSSEEEEALAAFLLPRRDRAQVVNTASQQGKLTRLMQPLADVFAVIEGDKAAKINGIHLLLRMWPVGAKLTKRYDVPYNCDKAVS